MASDCVSCGACVQACPTATLVEKTVIDMGQAERSVSHYLCLLWRRLWLPRRGEGQSEVVRMVPCRRGPRQRGPRLRQGPLRLGLRDPPRPHHHADDPGEDQRSLARSVVGGSADAHRERIPPHPASSTARNSIGAIVSSRCTNEEDYLVQKLVRTAFGNNNVDTCARVCHSPTGYGLKQTLGESAGTQTFKSVEQADVIVVIGANPSDAHPVFASRLKRRVREGRAS
jgi:formate dehydrogenase major subunit